MSLGAQTLPNQPIWKYTLLTGSELIVECPICALAPFTLPLQGTASLQAIEFTPGYALYAVTNVAFSTTNGPPFQYQLTGGGTYQAPGLPAFGQNMFLDLDVFDGTTHSEAMFTNAVSTITVKMPLIQINLDQTNGTPARACHLKLLAAPVPQFTSIVPDVQTQSVRLAWLSNGLSVQVERASAVGGPFAPVGAPTSDESFVDTGALINTTRLFYRLRWTGS
jgi:hypothetical protein